MTRGTRLRVVFDAAIFGHQRYGGVSRYFAELHRALGQRPDVDTRLLAGIHANGYLDRSVPGTYGFLGNRLPGRLRTRAGDLNCRLMDAASAILAPDIMHRTTFRPPNKQRVPTVITVHDFIHDLFPEYYGDGDYARRQADAIRRADGIICVSESTRQDLLRFHPDLATPVVVSHHGMSGIGPSTSELREIAAARVERSPKTLLYVGSRFGYKSFDLLLEALALLDRDHQWKLLCIGDDLTVGEHDLMRDLGLDPRRISTTRATDAELVRRYREAAMLVYPSAYEGFGLPILEALAQGCPVICDRNSSLPEVGGAVARYLPERSAEAVAALIHDLLTTTGEQSLVDAAAACAHAAGFNWERTAAEHLALYRSLVD